MPTQVTYKDIAQELESLLAPYLGFFQYPDGTQIPAIFEGQPPPGTTWAEPGIEAIVSPLSDTNPQNTFSRGIIERDRIRVTLFLVQPWHIPGYPTDSPIELMSMGDPTVVPVGDGRGSISVVKMLMEHSVWRGWIRYMGDALIGDRNMESVMFSVEPEGIGIV